MSAGERILKFFKKTSALLLKVRDYILKTKSGQDLTKQHVLSLSKKHRFPTWRQWKQLTHVLNETEKRVLQTALTGLVVGIIVFGGWYIGANRTEVPAIGGEYTEGLIGEPQFINPLYSTASDVDSDITNLVYSGLLKLDPVLGLVKDLAESLEISEDQKTYTFKIRDNAKWHNGQNVLASDVAFTIQSIQTGVYRSPLSISFRGVSVSQVDDRTVQFFLEEPFAPFLSTLTVGILPEEIWFEVDPRNAPLASLNLEPIGSGPYKFEKFTVDKRGSVKSYTVNRFKDYYGDRPNIERVTFKFYENAGAAFRALQNRNVEGVGFIPSDLVEDAEKEKSITVLYPNIPRAATIFFNQERNELLAEDEVREAIALALDKQAIVDTVLKGHGTVIHSPILQGSVGYDATIEAYEMDIQRANELLDETDYEWMTPETYRKKEVKTEDGETADEILHLVLTTTDNPEFLQTAELIKAQMLAIGIELEIEIVSSEILYTEVLKPRSYDLLLTATQPGIDPDPYPFWHSSQISDPGLNLAGYANRKVDEFLETARQTTDASEREEAYSEFQKIIAEDLPAIFLYQPTYRYAISTKIQNVSMDHLFRPSDRFGNITDWYIKTKKVLK